MLNYESGPIFSESPFDTSLQILKPQEVRKVASPAPPSPESADGEMIVLTAKGRRLIEAMEAGNLLLYTG
jgi:hypothetical protein